VSDSYLSREFLKQKEIKEARSIILLDDWFKNMDLKTAQNNDLY